MTRIFFSLALFALALLAVNLLIGLSIGDYNSAVTRWLDAAARVRNLERQRSPDADELNAARAAREELNQTLTPQRKRVSLHWLFGLSAALVTVLVNSVTVTYFIGTSRWCKEVCEAYSLDQELADRCARLKRRTFPWALCGILTVLGIVALGAASEPGNSLVRNSGDWVNFHLLGALLGVAIIGASFLAQAGSLSANYALVQDVMNAVRQVRSDRGLDTDNGPNSASEGGGSQG